MNKTLDFRPHKNPLIFIIIFAPSLAPLAKKLGMRFMAKDTADYFRGLFLRAFEERKKGSAERIDFLQLMLEAQEMKACNTYLPEEHRQKTPLTDKEVLSNCIIFFFAAFGTVGDAMSMTMYALAKHPDIQEKLLEEIEEVLGDSERCSYDQIKDLQYMDMVVHEGLRMYPPAQITDRVCSEDCVINGVKFPKGMFVQIPIGAIHRDPDIWPSPKKFIPERFAPERKAEMNPYHWLPFGLGPRNCIGMRMALIEMKIALVHIVRNFKLSLMDPTQELTRNKFSGSPLNLNLRIEKR
jgi:cytochrome P450 family 3 subfamily A